MEEFDLESVYDEKIAPLMSQIIAICNEHKMPVAATFQYNSDSRCTTTNGHGRQSEEMEQILIAMKPRRQAQALAIMETSNPDGSGKVISIKRI